MEAIATIKLSDLPWAFVDDLFARATPITVHEGETLCEIGDPCTGCYRLDDGLLKVFVTTKMAKEQIFALIAPRAILGAACTLDGFGCFATAVAVTTSKLSFIPLDVFQQFATEHPEIYREFAMVLANRTRHWANVVAAIALTSANSRVASILLCLGRVLGQRTVTGIEIPPVLHQDIAGLAGISRETVSRVLHDFIEQGLISKGDHSYRIENEKGLYTQVEENGIPELLGSLKDVIRVG